MAMEFMSTKNGGKGGAVVNVSSMGGQSYNNTIHDNNTHSLNKQHSQ